jgi:hypothetical protein
MKVTTRETTEQITENANKRAEWLRSLPGVKSAQPVSVTFNPGKVNEETIAGALYTQEFIPPVGSRNPARFMRLGVYLTSLPACYVRKMKPPRNPGESATVYANHVCFAPDGASGLGVLEWYMAGYYIGNVRDDFQPFGDNALMFPWDSGSSIDDYEKTPYKRVPVQVRDV